MGFSMPRNSRARKAAVLLLAACASLAACRSEGAATRAADAEPSAAERRAIADTISRLVRAAYDLERPGAEQRSIALYPDTGRVVSASAGHVITSRDSLVAGIRYFWENVAANMRQPRWIWDQMLVDVLSPNAAAMTATYHVPHLTPRNEPHVIGGAWTAVFEKRGGRWVIVQEHLSDLPQMPMAVEDTATKKSK